MTGCGAAVFATTTTTVPIPTTYNTYKTNPVRDDYSTTDHPEVTPDTRETTYQTFATNPEYTFKTTEDQASSEERDTTTHSFVIAPVPNLNTPSITITGNLNTANNEESTEKTTESINSVSEDDTEGNEDTTKDVTEKDTTKEVTGNDDTTTDVTEENGRSTTPVEDKGKDNPTVPPTKESSASQLGFSVLTFALLAMLSTFVSVFN